MLRTYRPVFAFLAVVAALAFATVSVDARSSGSFGSRGSRTFSSPAPTATAPKVAPIERTTTQPTRPGAATTGAATTQAAGQPARPGLLGGGMFGGGMLGGLAAGFIGAGLFGMLFGHGFMGGMGGFASMLGLLLQIGIIVVVARLAWNWWQRRNQPAFAGMSSLRQGGAGSGFPGFGGGSTPGAAPAEPPLEVKPEDFDAFERLLGEVMTAYGAEDLEALRARVTPEMLTYFSGELAKNASAGDINPISDVKLLQGDLSEAWREGQDEYASVAMRFSLKDRMIARTDGRLIKELPSEATEVWTFQRARGGNWVLSAIQQT